MAEIADPSWLDSGALKVHWDEDGFWDGLWGESPLKGLWRKNLPRLDFDVLIVTGRRTQEYFSSLGHQTAIVHKGFSPAHFWNQRKSRTAEIAMYGQGYISRILAENALRHAQVPVRKVSTPFIELGDALNASLASLSCTLDARRRRPVPSFLAKRFPERFFSTGPGPEPMLKLFEASACGCGTFTDYSPDLEELGFVDGQTAIVFEDIPELVEKALFYFDNPDLLAEIGSRAASLSHERHTWHHRVVELRDVVQRYL